MTQASPSIAEVRSVLDIDSDIFLERFNAWFSGKNGKKFTEIYKTASEGRAALPFFLEDYAVEVLKHA